VKDIQIAILDKSKDNTTKEITNKILSSGYFVLNKNIDSDKEIEEIFRQGDVKEVIIFESNFAKKLEKEQTAKIQLITDASDANTANLITNYTKGIIFDYLNKINKNIEMPMKIVPEVKMISSGLAPIASATIWRESSIVLFASRPIECGLAAFPNCS